MRSLDEILRDYLEALARLGSPAPRVIVGLEPGFDWNSVKLPEAVQPFDDLETYFARINGYGDTAVDETGSTAPTFAWDMHALSLDEAIADHDMADSAENPNYWPAGFLPLLSDGGGSYVVVNCIRGSPTFGAVYAMDEGVGCTQLATSLGRFFEACTQEITHGLREYWRGELRIVRATRERWLKLQPQLFGNSPYFTRSRMDQQVVDWKPRGLLLDTISRLRTRWRENRLRTPVSAAPAEPAAASPRPVSPEQEAIRRWAVSVGWIEPIESDYLNVELSTAPVEHWYFQKSKLRQDTVSIRATVHHDRWLVQLERKDRLFQVQWRSNQTLLVDSEQLKYKRLMRWPELDDLAKFPAFVNDVAAVLGIRFLPYVNIDPNTPETEGLRRDPRLVAWLAPCAGKIGCYIGGEH